MMPDKQRKRMLTMTNAPGIGIFRPKTIRNEIMSMPFSPKNGVQAVEQTTKLQCATLTTSYDGLYDILGRGTPDSPYKDILTVPSMLSPYTDSFEHKIAQIDWPEDVLTLPQSARNSQIRNLRCLAVNHLKITNLTPNEAAINKTQQAAKDFFILAHDLLSKSDSEYPLAGKNKCLGFATIKGNKSVFIAISQSENAREDLELRRNMIALLSDMNEESNRWRFELVNTPQPVEYLMPRFLDMRTTRPASPNEVKPRMRCIEVALMVALNKARRTIKYSPSDASMQAFNSTLWASANAKESSPKEHFGSITRNDKYLFAAPLEINLADGTKAYIDQWKPCEEHCAKYLMHMLAVAASDEHFYGPRADGPINIGSATAINTGASDIVASRAQYKYTATTKMSL
jgi:hypothetical protein